MHRLGRDGNKRGVVVLGVGGGSKWRVRAQEGEVGVSVTGNNDVDGRREANGGKGSKREGSAGVSMTDNND